MKHVHCEIAFFSLLWQQHPRQSKAFWTSTSTDICNKVLTSVCRWSAVDLCG